MYIVSIWIYTHIQRSTVCYIKGVVPGTSWIAVVFLCARTLKFLLVLSATESDKVPEVSQLASVKNSLPRLLSVGSLLTRRIR